MVKVDKKYNFLKPIKSSNLIRLGREADGGYVVDSKIIEQCKNLISFGMGFDWTFELDYLKQNGLNNKGKNEFKFYKNINNYFYFLCAP